MKPYEIKPHHKAAVLRSLLELITEQEDEATLLGATQAEIWAYREVRMLIKERISKI